MNERKNKESATVEQKSTIVYVLLKNTCLKRGVSRRKSERENECNVLI